jgi:N-acetyl-alpha-D-glucosaminyl L-malate synthase BshA
MARTCAQSLAAAGHQVHLLTSAKTFWDDASLMKVKTHGVSVPETPAEPNSAWTHPLSEEIAATVKKEGIEILNVHYVAGLLEAALAAKALLAKDGKTLKIAATLHGSDVRIWGRNPKHAEALKAQLEQCDQITAVSHHLADLAISTFDLAVRPTVIENSIDEINFHPGQWSDIRARLAPRGEVVFCHVSNMRAVKRPLDAVDTFAKVFKAGVPSKLLLVGDGPMMEQVYERAMQHGVAEQILCTGPLPPDKLAKYVAASDFCLVTSETESFCLAALEAMAMGTPVVGTHCGGLDEIMSTVDPGVDRVSKLLANVGDSDQMARVCLELIRDPRRYQSVQEQCVRVPLEKYPNDRQAQGYLTMIDDLRPSQIEVDERSHPLPPPAGNLVDVRVMQLSDREFQKR